MRMIDADANIETMKKCAANPESEQALLCYRFAQRILEFAQRILEEAPTVEPASPWHRVEEELPEIGRPVVVSNHGDMWTATRLDEKAYGGRRYWEYSDGDWVRIEDDMYWMPLPEPPKEDA